jgi:integrase
MGKTQPILKPVIKRGDSWYIEWYFEHGGQRRRIRKSRHNGIDLNSIARPDEREAAAQLMLKELKARLCPPALEPEHEEFLPALQTALELKRSAKWKTNKSFAEVVRWVGEYFTLRGWQYLRCNQVTPEHIQCYFDHIIVKLKVANSTHNTRKNNLRSIFTELVKRHYFPSNYVAMVKDRKAADPIRRPLSEDEKKIVAAHIFKHDKPLTLAFVLLCYLAIRPGEIRDLRVGSIDLNRGVVRFPSSDSKNNRNSVVTIPEQLIPMLQSLQLHQYPASHYLFGKAKGRHNANMLPRDEQIGVNTLSGRFRTLLRTLHKEGKLSDINGLQFYSLKDTLAIFLLDSGVDLETAMRHFRHGDLHTFQRYVKRLGVVSEKIQKLPIDLDL